MEMGKVIIKTELDTKPVDKKMASLETKYKNKQIDIEITAKELEFAKKELTAIEKIIDENNRKEERLNEELKKQYELKEFYSKQGFGTASEEQNIDRLLDKINTIQDETLKTYDNWEKQNFVVDKISAKFDKQMNDLDVINNELNQMNLGDINFNLEKIGKGIQKVTKNVVKWGLAIFSVRSAYMAVRRSVSMVSQYNEDVANKIKYISYAFSMLLEPIIIRLVDWVYKLMSYIDYIAQKWFNLNGSIFKSAKSMQKANKAANELRKTIAGFDEMNILNDNVGGGSSGLAPELKAISDGDASWLLKWIGNNKNLILSLLAGVVAAVLTLKAGLGAVLAIIIGITASSIVDTIQNIIAFVKDPSWENFNKILETLSVAILGVSAALIILNASNPVGWILLATGAVVAATAAVGELVRKTVENKAAIKDVEQAEKDLQESRKKARKAEQNYTKAIDNNKQAHEELLRVEKETKINGYELYKQVEDGTIKYETMSEAQQQVYKAYLKTLETEEELVDVTNELSDSKKKVIQDTIEEKLAIAHTSGSYKEFKDTVVEAMESGKISMNEAKDTFERAMADMDTAQRNTFMRDLPNNIKDALNPQKYEGLAHKFANWWNNMINGLSKNVKISVSGGGSGAFGGGKVEYTPRAKGGIYYPKLAVGGIINQPGRGIPYHGATIGERGAEAVLPLTDSQQMALLGEAIGKYININATVPVYVGNRMVAKELKRINAEDNFAYNR